MSAAVRHVAAGELGVGRFFALIAVLFVALIAAPIAVLNILYGVGSLAWPNALVGLVMGAIELGALLLVKRWGQPPQPTLIAIGAVIGGVGWLLGLVWLLGFGFVGDPVAFAGLLFPLPGAVVMAAAPTAGRQ